MKNSYLFAVILLASAMPGCCADTEKVSKDEDGFQWLNAISESFLQFSVTNFERAVTQPDTRQAIRGPFWQKYANSVQNLYGWNDGDGFETSYVLHPMEGALGGYIERQNDPRYRDVEFGSSQRYWISCMRALAFSTAFSTLWSASPFGEAGVGNVELHNKPGLVDLIGTPTMGLGWMIGEDALDRYVVRRIEWRVRNPVVRALARSTVNPMRSYANVLAFRRPWQRYDRPGVIYAMPEQGAVEQQRATEERFRPEAWPKAALEFMAAPVVEYFPGRYGGPCLGAAGEAAVGLSAMTDVVFDIDGCSLSNVRRNVSGDTLTYAAGLRWRFRTKTKWTPYITILVGGAKVTHVTYDPEKEQELRQKARERGKVPPDWADYHSEADTNGFTLVGEAGVNHRLSNLLSWRVGSVGYQRSWTLNRLDGFNYDQGLRVMTGIAITMGPWSR
ncbi:MAG: hypothetical protein JO270_20950 [Acidobacteriaceae bacterium]|nr:hypothetical protein [Acidobacteriaceae bacterium]MBV8572382.1 hypothetical protein [Acidobacteriaceae bacterium]